MNVHSLSNPTHEPFSLSKTRRGGCLEILLTNRFKDAALRRKFRHSAQPDAPELFEMSYHGAQDFVSHAACAVCETTGTGCAAGSKPANGSGVGCPINW